MAKNFGFYFIACILFFSCVSLVEATETNIGTKKLNDCIDLIQICADCSYINFTSYTEPNGTRYIIEAAGIKNGAAFTYNTCNITNQVGTWIVDGHGDVGGTDTVFAYTYEVTTTGKPTPEGMPTFQIGVIIIIFGISCFLLFLSSQINEVGLKIFFLLTSFIFLMSTMLSAYMISADNNVASSINTTILSLFTVLGAILFIIFLWVLIRQTVNALDMYRVKRGYEWSVGPGSKVAGYNTKRAY